VIEFNEIVANNTISIEQLFAACARGGTDREWEQLTRSSHMLVTGVLWNVASRYTKPSQALIEDLVQDTWLTICLRGPTILAELNRASEKKASAYGLLKVISANVARDHFKSQRRQRRSAEGRPDAPLDEILAVNTPRSPMGASEAERDILVREIDEILQSLNRASGREHDRRIFWLYYRHGFTAQEIAC
jgi:RNA polymerase sigma-70 factor (ECF subfamily)